MPVDLDSLRYALTLADELHFGRSAARHFISEPQFGRRIRRLEAQVGIQIFERTSRRVSVTAEGADVLDRARRILGEVDDLRSLAARDRTHDDHVIRLGVLGFGAGDRWRLLREFVLAAVPDVQITYRPLSLDDQHSALMHDEVDVAVVHDLGAVDGIDRQWVMDTERVAVVPVTSPLAQYTVLDGADIGQYSWLRLVGSDERFNEWVGPCSASQGAPTVGTLDSVAMAVATTELLGLHGAPAAQFFPHPDVRFVPIAGLSPISIAVASRNDDDREVVRAFRSAARLVAGP